VAAARGGVDQPHHAETSETDGIGRWHLASLAGVALVAALLYAPHPPKGFRAEFDPTRYPANAVSALGNIPRRGSSPTINGAII